jgi:Uma2 family endonuclease
VNVSDDGREIEGGFDLNSIMYASEPLTTKDFFALDVDEKFKVELIGGALAMSPSPMFWHNRAANRLFRILEDSLGRQFPVFTDIDVTLDETTVVRPDVFVINTSDFSPNRTASASEVVLAIEIVSPGSRVNDRQVKPHLYRDAEIPSWRVEQSEGKLYIVETPVRGDEKTHLGKTTLEVAGIEIVVDLEAIAAYAFGTT